MISDVIIMAGGFGERLWPASSPSHPKQFMAINDNISFLQESLNRALALNVSGKIIIVTRKDIEDECTRQVEGMTEFLGNDYSKKLLEDCIVIAEPCPKHTSAAIMTAISYIKNSSKLNEKHICLVLTSDHIIEPVEVFINDSKKASLAAENGNFVCYAIPPTEPATGYGYIKTGLDLYNDGSVFKIDNFKEKPDFETAKQYLQEGNYWWNSGMFAFDMNIFLSEMNNYTPEVSDSFKITLDGKIPKIKRKNGIQVIKKWPELDKTYQTVPAIAVDKSIAEKTNNAAVVKANFSWTDVGSWDTFSELCTNPINNKTSQVECNNNFIYSDLPIALCGVNDLVVVVKNGKVLIMKKGSSSLVRDAVKELE
ncbi:MAG: mannose-1-phosphate guanylyltransferase [Treponema sp.]|nr:mannose-1-phosphate guanylyltransferase [Treponema sp.]MBP3607835.1 mannose-1-phosphate guanylyltransferase [Treponema sp.]